MLRLESRPIWWLPTLGFFILLGVELSILVGPSRIFEDPGVGRHLRTAEVILETGQIPTADPLSFTHGGEPWFDFEWAFETTLAVLYQAGGLGLIAIYCTPMFATTVMGIYRTLLRSQISLPVQVIYTVVAFLTLHLHFAVRPVLITYLLMGLVVEAWRCRSHPNLRDWLTWPCIFAVWANVHSGWMAALIFLAGSTLGRFCDRVSGRVTGEEAPIIPWIGITALCLLATSLNPWGWELHKHLALFAAFGKSIALWDESVPPNFANLTLSGMTMLFLIGIILLARAAKRPPRWSWEIALPLLFFFMEALKSQRHVLLLVIVAAVPVAKDFDALLRGGLSAYLRSWSTFLGDVLDGVGERFAAFQMRQQLAAGDGLWAFLASGIFAAAFLSSTISQNIEVGHVNPKLVAFLQMHPDRFQRPLTTTANAGPLLWAMRPDFRVSFDDRGDFYGDPVVFWNVDLVTGAPGWDKKLVEGNYDSLLLDPGLPLNQFLKYTSDWQETYRDENVVAYWKQQSPSCLGENCSGEPLH